MVRLANVVLLFALLASSTPALAQQVPDTTADTRVARPAHVAPGPRLAIDEAHHEFHRMAGRYRPFADLMRADGCRVSANVAPFDSTALSAFDVLVIANALGDEDMGSPAASHDAFTAAECRALVAWVRAGGALLLVADHAPMGDAARALAESLGVDMRAAYTRDPVRAEGGNPTVLHFRENAGLATDHPIIAGRDSSERVRHVLAFTGQSLAGPPGAVSLLTLSDRAEDLLVKLGESVRNAPDEKRRAAAGRAQAVAFAWGRGRVVVLGEAAMLSAQIAGGRMRMGFNVPETDDRQFALNVVRWLTRVL